MSESAISVKKFRDINVDDPFFDSLKDSYAEFTEWFSRKADENAYVSYTPNGMLQAFLYLKVETGPINDVTPPLNASKCLKVGTFKTIAHGTKLGERFVKIIVDTVLSCGLRLAYLTVFPQHESLIKILEAYGFSKRGSKVTHNGTELLYVKDMQYISGDPKLDYPVVDSRGHNKWLMSIYADFHTSLFPDSILKTEKTSIIQDTSFTNSIHKVYVGAYRDFPLVRSGDCLVIYRCVERDSRKSAWFGSVATSLCAVEEIYPTNAFQSVDDFISYCKRYSVFNEEKLRGLYKNDRMYAVKMTYNLAFPRRPTLGTLVQSGAVPHPGTETYMGFLPLSDMSFSKILSLGGVREGFVIH